MYWCKFMVWFQVGLVLVILCHTFNRRCLIQITSCSKCSCQNINLNKIFTTHIFSNFWIFCWIFQSVDSVLLCISWLTGKFLKKSHLRDSLCSSEPRLVPGSFVMSFANLLVSPAHTNEWSDCVYLWVISFPYRLHQFILADAQEVFPASLN